MTSQDRIDSALQHKEGDRVPIDFGGHLITSIHMDCYTQLLEYLGEPTEGLQIERYRQRTAVISEDIYRRFQADFRPLVPPWPDLKWSHEGDDTLYTDEWGVSWKQKGKDGLYFEHCASRFEDMPSVDDLKAMDWPDYARPERIAGLADKAEAIIRSGAVPILDLPLGLEIFDAGFNLCGSSNFYMLLALAPDAAAYIMDKQLEAQLDWWRQAIEAMPALNLIRIGDDLGAQDSMLIDPDMYRSLVLPRHEKLFRGIKDMSKERIRIILHSDGAILPVLGDLIDAGIDALNPIQYTVSGIDPAHLKEEYGKDLTFWGGGVDSQNILPNAKPAEVKAEVRKQLDILAPGGGYVFSPIHILQKDVPPENIVAIMEAALEYGGY